jgi:hypothetical protein
MSEWLPVLTFVIVVAHAIAHAIGKYVGLNLNNSKRKE